MNPGTALLQIRMAKQYIAAVSIPGIMPAISSLPIEVSVMIPYRTKAILGGIMIASVPATVTTPAETLLEYPCFTICGTAIVDSVAAEAVLV